MNLLSEYGLLDKNILFSHVNGIAESDAQTLVKHGAFFSTTPDTELQMGLGGIVAFRPDVKCNASIGVDCHANNSGDLLTQLRIGLQHSRATDNIKALQAGQHPSVQVKLEEVFNLGTIQGAKAVNMEDQIGSIAVGKLADLVIFDSTSPGMICAAEENPLAALLLHANVGDIEMVIVDEIRKERRQLADVKTLESPDGQAVESVAWGELTGKLLKSREDVKKRGQGQDQQAGMQFLFKAFL
jgi:cytosine/adenosine deaminase-related metal-dependent hydrolase